MDKLEQAEQDYMHGMKYKDIADKYGISINTIKSWKQRNGWSRDGKEKGCIQKSKGAPKNNQYTKGNKSGSAPKGNKNAVTHVLFAKWLPEESKEIMEVLGNRGQTDMLLDSIIFQYTAIIRAQNIMFVKDQDNMTKEKNRRDMGRA
ncbi:terminase gpP N-terminus-related DNA-binding protein [Carnobacterium sp. TMP28]|uniref:terminase gpP N-terminus-related DNA-binding protein n=1 Tax=Carnobacterium sp. TMP28 TaxID=3397060 RepID=UPI0039E04676